MNTYEKFKITTILGIFASIVSIVVNWPSGVITAKVFLTEFFIITGIVPLVILTTIFFNGKRYAENNKNIKGIIVLVFWMCLILGITFLLFTMAPQLNFRALQLPGNLAAGLVFLLGAAISLSQAVVLKIDLLP